MSPVETEILGLFEAYRRAVYDKDLEAFLAIYNDELVAYDMWGVWSYAGLPAWREMTAGWFNGLGTDRDVVTFAEPKIRAEGATGFAYAFVNFTAVSSEGRELRGMTNRITWGLRRGASGWKVVHQHTSAPIDNQTKAIFRR